MTLKALARRFALNEDLNFLLTNRIPRHAATRFMGWFSRIEQPLVRDLSLAAWRLFADLDLSDAARTRFRSLHDCFTRELVPGARPADPDPAVLASPCDAIVGACGRVEDVHLLQAKGFPYTLQDLLADPRMVEACRDSTYATLRITSSMYHRFHAPHDLEVEEVTYLHGDTWNVNPIALARVERLFCRNERAVVATRLRANGQRLVLVPVAAILVAGIRLTFADVLLHLGYRGPTVIPCSASIAKGEEMGWFEHGSTILVFAPRGSTLCAGIEPGRHLRAGEALMRLPTADR